MNHMKKSPPQSGNQATATAPTIDVEKIRADAAAKATEDTRIRLKAITTAVEAKRLPSLAAHFAYDTEVSAEVAIAAMKAAFLDLNTTAAALEADKAESFEHQKVADGALGLGQDEKLDFDGSWKTLQ